MGGSERLRVLHRQSLPPRLSLLIPAPWWTFGRLGMVNGSHLKTATRWLKIMVTFVFGGDTPPEGSCYISVKSKGPWNKTTWVCSALKIGGDAALVLDHLFLTGARGTAWSSLSTKAAFASTWVTPRMSAREFYYADQGRREHRRPSSKSNNNSIRNSFLFQSPNNLNSRKLAELVKYSQLFSIDIKHSTSTSKLY